MLLDPDAECELCRRYGNRLEAFALARTRDRLAAQELASDVLLAVIGSLRKGVVRHPENLDSFVFGTALNLIHNFVRRRKRRLELLPLSIDVAGPDPFQFYQHAELIAGIEKAIQVLPSADQQILRLGFVDGFKSEEIGRRLELSSAVVRQRKARALGKLRLLLERFV